ncbi:phosphoprotein [avian paramyxovirus 4]|uniref:Phosphoprotein n=1 Tax=avian paramyxovirus 4 TaxID=28274 RepID=K7XE52_9MONO|nr:phosphoprotein [Avian paramyxovirus 4]AFX60879.1 phosphoprotein [Avian paramyxovirus 4]
MDFTDIDAVNSLIESSSAIIDSIQHGGLQPAGTVGLSQIPKGITSALNKAWEAEAATAGSGDTQHKPDDPEDHQARDTESLEDTGNDPATQGTNIVETPHPEVLSAAKARLKRPKAGKDTHGNPPTQPDHFLKGGLPSPQPTAPRMQSPPNHGSSSTADPRQSQTQDHSPTGEKWQLSPTKQPETSNWWSGATQGVQQSELNQPDLTVYADTAPPSAVSACMTTDQVQLLMKEVADIKSLLQALVRNLAVLPQLRNEVAAIRTSQAMIEGTLNSIKILDPGNYQESSLNSWFKPRQEHTVIVSGPGNPLAMPTPVQDSTIFLDELARPHPNLVNPSPPVTSTNVDLGPQKQAAIAYVSAKCKDPGKRDQLSRLIERAATLSEINKVKRQALGL